MTFTSLQGYIRATYQELVEEFGNPTYSEPSGDEKVNTEWDLFIDDTRVTIYDWKDYDLGKRSRSGEPYRWHIGGTGQSAVNIVATRLNRMAYRA